MNIKPIDDRVLIELVEEPEKVGSIYIPETAKEKPRRGKVIAVGTDEDLKELIKEGQEVLFTKYGGDEITVDNKQLLILQRADIIAIIE